MNTNSAGKEFFVHSLAVCDSNEVGEGTRIWAFAHILVGARIGRNCNLGEGVFVEGGASIGDRCTIKNGIAIWDRVTLEDDVFLGPYVVLTNDLRPRAFLKRGKAFYLPTRIQRGATVGANATLVCGVTLGEFAMVGAGSVVVEDVPPHALVVGNPARSIGLVCFCGERLNAQQVCGACQLPLAENNIENTKAIFASRRPAPRGDK